MVGQEPSRNDIEQAARMCVNMVRKGAALTAAATSLCVIRAWDDKTWKEFERLAEQILKGRKG